MKSIHIFTTFVLFTLMSAGCADDSSSDSDAGDRDAGFTDTDREMQAPIKLGCDTDGESGRTVTQAVINGTDTAPTRDVRIVAGQEDAPGALVRSSNGAIFCSGTLVTDDIVVTAAHCVLDFNWSGHPEDAPGAVMDPADLLFSIGHDASSPITRLPVEAIHVHPEVQGTWGDWRRLRSSLGVHHDLAVLVLARPASELAPGVTPIPIHRNDLAPLLGNTVIVGGYGRTGPQGNPDASRHWASLQLTRANRDYFGLLITGDGSTASGDSGSGLLISTDAGPRVMGITQGPIVPSGEFGSRLDAHKDWLDEFIGTGCIGVSEPTCDGNRLQFCEDGTAVSRNCSEDDLVCGTDACGQIACVAPAADPDPRCDALDYNGRCTDEETVEWCLQGEYMRRNCVGGATCGQSPDPRIGFTCLSQSDTIGADVGVDQSVDVGMDDPEELATCNALLECSEACQTDMWCHFDCFVHADMEATAAWSAIGSCQNCALSGFGCIAEDSHFMACSTECGQNGSKLATTECTDCLTQTCQSVEDECRAR